MLRRLHRARDKLPLKSDRAVVAARTSALEEAIDADTAASAAESAGAAHSDRATDGRVGRHGASGARQGVERREGLLLPNRALRGVRHSEGDIQYSVLYYSIGV